MRQPLRTFPPEFRSKVAFAALKSNETVAELTEQFELNANQIIQHAAENVSALFVKEG